ncbi:hypothetical protein AC578_1464 [Pseudocercospora eumusae]|uniref:Uncharacterized protein n=1 Tax=Pseudocercospora eumusae TaxID=321146 RepID=A0A139H6G8_9PEZI|nr:hypothetical protein AC578_1464 [Pseudocercospora eumusae]
MSQKEAVKNDSTPSPAPQNNTRDSSNSLHTGSQQQTPKKKIAETRNDFTPNRNKTRAVSDTTPLQSQVRGTDTTTPASNSRKPNTRRAQADVTTPSSTPDAPRRKASPAKPRGLRQ